MKKKSQRGGESTCRERQREEEEELATHKLYHLLMDSLTKAEAREDLEVVLFLLSRDRRGCSWRRYGDRVVERASQRRSTCYKTPTLTIAATAAAATAAANLVTGTALHHGIELL